MQYVILGNLKTTTSVIQLVNPYPLRCYLDYIKIKESSLNSHYDTIMYVRSHQIMLVKWYRTCYCGKINVNAGYVIEITI